MNNENEVLLKFLRDLGISNLTKNEKKTLGTMINERKNINIVQKELELLYVLNKVLIESYSTVSFNNMMQVYKDIDDDLLLQLFITFNQIKSKSLDNKTAIVRFRKVCEDVLKNNKKVNFAIKSMLNEEISKIESIRNVLYFGMDDREKADKLFANCRKRSKHFLNNCDVNNLSNLIDYVKKNYHLSDSELVDISSRCATFFVFSSAGKIKKLDDVIEDLKTFIITTTKGKDESSKVSKLLGRDFKDIITNSSTFVTSNLENVQNTIRFLKGESISMINPDFLHSEVGNVKGEFNAGQLAKIYNESITSINTSVDKIANVCLGVSSAYKRAYGKELPFDGFINGRNFASISQLRNEDFDGSGKINEIFELLKPFVREDEMVNLLENNLGFLIAETPEVKRSLKNALLISRNNDELKINVLSKIKNHFDTNGGMDFSKFAKTTPIAVDKAKKVILNDMEEEQIVDLLEKLSSSEQEIESWKSKWKDETKELHDLGIEIELTEISESLDVLEEMISNQSMIYDEFVQEQIVMKNLFEEVLNKHYKVISENKLNKHLKEIDEKVNDKIESTMLKFDESVNKMIKYYSDSLTDLNKSLSLINAEKNKYQELQLKIESLENELLKLEITEQSLKNQSEIIADLTNLLKESDKKHKMAYGIEDKTNQLVDAFYDKLTEINPIDINEFTFDALKDIHVDDYQDPNYLFKLFLLCLLKDDLIYDDMSEEEKEVNPKDRDMNYNRYKVLLTEDQRYLADMIYNGFTFSAGAKSEIFDALVDALEDHKVDVSGINTIKKATAAIYKLTEGYKKKHSKEYNLFNSRKILENQVTKFDIDGLDNQYQNLNDTISDYHQKMMGLEKSKYKKNK